MFPNAQWCWRWVLPVIRVVAAVLALGCRCALDVFVACRLLASVSSLVSFSVFRASLSVRVVILCYDDDGGDVIPSVSCCCCPWLIYFCVAFLLLLFCYDRRC